MKASDITALMSVQKPRTAYRIAEEVLGSIGGDVQNACENHVVATMMPMKKGT